MRHSGSPLVLLFGYLSVSLLLGSALAFPVYLVVAPVYDGPFENVLQRVIVLVALLLVPFYLSRAGTADRCALGFGCSRRAFLRSFTRWLGVGILVAGSLQLAFLLLGIRVPASVSNLSVLDVLMHVSHALLASVLIGLLEEAYFRGALLGSLRSMSSWVGVFVVAVIYAAAHFLGGPVPHDELRWSSGLFSIGSSPFRLDAFLALLAAGVLLGAMRLRFGHVAASAGVHAGCVLCIRIAQEFGDLDPDSSLAFLAGSLAGTMGYLGLMWIVLLGGGWYVWSRFRRVSSAE